MKPEALLSRWYQAVKATLEGHWNGTYGALARAVGYTHSRRAAQVMGRLVKSYSLRHPEWDATNVYRKDTGLPGFMS